MKQEGQKSKLIRLANIFEEKTDEFTGLSIEQLKEELMRWEISVERKTLYTDIETLRECGMDIMKQKFGRRTEYSLVSRLFELAELKLLVDSVQSARFITEEKSRELIKKLTKLASVNQAKELQRQVIINGRVKTINQSILNNIDKLHQAINENQQISFQYCSWDVDLKLVPRHNGALYVLDPWRLVWADDNYYLIAYDNELDLIKHFRVDKMKRISVVDAKRTSVDKLKGLDITNYQNSLFGMFGGEPELVTIEARIEMIGVFIDRFGKDIRKRVIDDEHVEFRVNVVPSNMFLGWIIGLGPGVKITSPSAVVEKMKEVVARLDTQYN